jgi:DAK2 domain fusion protein YloV
VLNPVEGTILSVIAAAAGAVAATPTQSQREQSLEEVVMAARQAAAAALLRTPDQLPALARAGVVDAGGAGLLLLFDSLAETVVGHPVEDLVDLLPYAARRSVEDDQLTTTTSSPAAEDLGPRYEVMFLLKSRPELIGPFREAWAGIGDSIVVVGDEAVYNCHIHTDDIGAAIEVALDAGRPSKIRVSDLHEQVQEERWVAEALPAVDAFEGPEPTCDVVPVIAGDGVSRLFRSLGTRYGAVGGQSMNPSVADLMEAICSTRATQVVLLPNNPNVVPVARAAAQLAATSEPPRLVEVVPTQSVVEGLSAMVAYDPCADAATNSEMMLEAAASVCSAEVTQAVRDSECEIGHIRAGDWIGVSNSKVICAEEQGAGAAVARVIDQLVQPSHGLVTIIEGDGSSPAETRRATEAIKASHPSLELEVHRGGQPIYAYLIGLE